VDAVRTTQLTPSKRLKVKGIAVEDGREYNRRLNGGSLERRRPRQPCMRLHFSGPNMDAIRSISDDVRNSNFRGHSFNLVVAIVTVEGPGNGAKTEKDCPNIYLKFQFT